MEKRLIDVSRNNNLLYFKPFLRSTLDIGKASDSIVSDLLAGKTIRIDRLVSATGEASIPRNLKTIRATGISNREERGIETQHLALGLATWEEEDCGEAPAWFF